MFVYYSNSAVKRLMDKLRNETNEQMNSCKRKLTLLIDYNDVILTYLVDNNVFTPLECKTVQYQVSKSYRIQTLLSIVAGKNLTEIYQTATIFKRVYQNNVAAIICDIIKSVIYNNDDLVNDYFTQREGSCDSSNSNYCEAEMPKSASCSACNSIDDNHVFEESKSTISKMWTYLIELRRFVCNEVLQRLKHVEVTTELVGESSISLIDWQNLVSHLRECSERLNVHEDSFEEINKKLVKRNQEINNTLLELQESILQLEICLANLPDPVYYSGIVEQQTVSYSTFSPAFRLKRDLSEILSNIENQRYRLCPQNFIS